MGNAAQSSGTRRWAVGIYGVVVVVLAATAYEAAFALQIIHLPAGAHSGEGPRFETHIVDYAPSLHRAGSAGLEVWWVVFGVVVTDLVRRLGSGRLRAALLTTAATMVYAGVSVVIIRGFH
jgi:hypothetical protein